MHFLKIFSFSASKARSSFSLSPLFSSK